MLWIARCVRFIEKIEKTCYYHRLIYTVEKLIIQ
jgi:hypothetical protein